jgi:glycosyltransferase involved in cell wall biosynthesis
MWGNLIKRCYSKLQKRTSYKGQPLTDQLSPSTLDYKEKVESAYLILPNFLEVNGPDSHYGEMLKMLQNFGLKVHYVATESSSLKTWEVSSFSNFSNVEVIFPDSLIRLLRAKKSVFINCGSPWFYRNSSFLAKNQNVLIDYLFNHVGHTRSNILIRDLLFHTVCQHQALATVLSETDPSMYQYSCIPIPFPKINPVMSKPVKETSNPLWVGRLSKEKGIDRLAKIAKEYYSRSGEPIDVIGSGPLLYKIKDLSLNGKINYLGELSHKQTLEKIESAKTVFNTSYIEGVSLVALESLSLGTAVLSFNVGGMNDLIWHPGMNIWNDANDLIGFSKKIFEINSNLIDKTEFQIPFSYTQEFQKEEWKKIIDFALTTLG